MAAPMLAPDAAGPDGAPASRVVVAAVVALFFLWGGLTSLNDILVPKLKGLFSLSYAQAMLTQFAFFMAYFIVSLPAGWLIARLGYVKGIVVGLAIMACGCLLFVPASGSGLFVTFLAALFVLASGITILQVAANPLIASLGSAATASSRLTLAQAFNALGTTLFPPVGAAVILGALRDVDPARLAAGEREAFLVREAAVIGHAYLGIAAILAAGALFFWVQRRRMADGAQAATGLGGSLALLSRWRVGFGVLGIFLYVGAEVSIGSLLVNYLAQPGVMGLAEADAGKMIAFYWGGAMAGRFVGAFVLRFVTPGKLLCGVAIGAAGLALCSAASSGAVAGFLLLAVGLMNAIMFPTIFSLAVEGQGTDTPRVSGLLCMAIVGGAIVPLLVGLLADATTLATALVIPALCYLAIAAYGWRTGRAAA
jgi:FHS family L-fucose permease-like MFS transporter